MSRQPTNPRRAAVATIVVAVLAAGTGLAMAMSGHDGPTPVGVATAIGTPATTTTGSTTTPAGSAAAPSVTSAASSPATNAAHGSGRPVATSGSRPGTTTKPPVTTTSVAATGSSGPAPAAPGTYRYQQTGSLPGTPAEGTLVVSPVSATGTQTWTRLVGGTIPPSTSVMLFNDAGSFLVSPGGQAAGGGASSCTFAAPVPWPLWPTNPGRSTSAEASCTGSVHSYQVTEQVQGTASLTLDGGPVSAAVVVTTIVLKGQASGSPLTVTMTETDYYAASLRVPVLTRTHIVGTAVGIPITTDRTDTLVSANPA